ncbi:MAG: FAD binding domain-containing protein [Thermoanaerobaculia bacterium]
MNRFEWVSVSTVEGAIAQLSHGATAKAGGIDLLDRMKEGLEEPERVVNLRGIAGLDSITADDGGLHLGALATLAQIAASPVVRSRWPALATAALGAATPQIRNAATLGGNLLQRPRCWYFRSAEFRCLRKGGSECFAIPGENQYHAVVDNDICAMVHPSAAAIPLMAYRAVLEVAGPEGKRDIPLESFFVLPSEDVTREHSLPHDSVVTGIRVPAPPKGARSAYLKQGEKESFDWPLADAAAVLVMDGSRIRNASIVLGAASPVPKRAGAAEQWLVGKPLDDATAREAARRAMEGATPLSKNGWKVPLFQTVIARVLLAAAGGPAAGGTR